MHHVSHHLHKIALYRRWYIPVLLSCFCLFSFAACAPTAGILSSSSWQPSGLQNHSIRTLEVDDKDPQKLYAGDAVGNIFVSTDAGDHWAQKSIEGISSPDPIHMLALSPNGKKLYAATEQGLFVSVDSTQTWSKANTPASKLPVDSYTAITFDINAPMIVYAGTAHNGVFTSADDGIHWSPVSTGLPQHTTINSLILNINQHQLWAATATGVYRADERENSWQALNTGFPAGITINMVLPAEVNGGAAGLIFAGTSNGFFRSEDAGMHWTTDSNALVGVKILQILIDFRSNNVTTLYVGTNVGAFRSDDNGLHWQGIAPGLPRGKPVYALILGASNYAQLYVASDNVYLFPGKNQGISASRILAILVVVVFFLLLYRVALRGRRKRRDILKPERIIESSTPAPKN